jgi:23S rRNA (cytosine1962-C5)-methyltransferase
MAAPRSRPRRYQLKRDAAASVAAGHPWVFRRGMSSAAEVFADGQALRLYDGDNRIVGHGVFASAGAIAIRVVRRGPAPLDAAFVSAMIDTALARRAGLCAETDGFRALHGENDGLPAITLDVYGNAGVLATYAAGVDAVARLAAAEVRRRLGLGSMLWRPGHRTLRTDAPARARALWGTPPAIARVHEGPLILAVDLAGQKSGAFLDLRGLRRALAAQPLTGARVLDLFSYTGSLGLAAAAAGATEVVHVDASAGALRFGATHHALGPARHAWLAGDLFRGLPVDLAGQSFDVVIVDPPQMTSRVDQVPRALAAYRRLYARVERHVAAGGSLYACCCTARIGLAELRRTLEEALPGFVLVARIPPEADHPVGFAQADYLKVLHSRRVPAPAGAAPG